MIGHRGVRVTHEEVFGFDVELFSKVSKGDWGVGANGEVGETMSGRGFVGLSTLSIRGTTDRCLKFDKSARVCCLTWES